jgi:predicted RNase H-like HicB family nuclease
MQNKFTEIVERDGDWFIASCPEVPGAYGRGRTTEEARTSLAEAIALIREGEDFEREVALVRQNQELMKYLDERSRPSRTYSIEQARRILGIVDPDPTTENLMAPEVIEEPRSKSVLLHVRHC